MTMNWRHTPEEISQYMTVSPSDGTLIWKPRDGGKRAKSWTARFGGKPVSVYPSPKEYLQFRFQGTAYLAHRVVWAISTGEWPEGQIDHINGDRSDNRIANLRVVTAAENARNRERRKDRQGKVGVTFYARANLWRAQIGVNGEKISLGYFKTFDAAVRARVEAEREHGFHKNHGRYAPVTPVKESRLAAQ